MSTGMVLYGTFTRSVHLCTGGVDSSSSVLEQDTRSLLDTREARGVVRSCVTCFSLFSVGLNQPYTPSGYLWTSSSLLCNTATAPRRETLLSSSKTVCPERHVGGECRDDMHQFLAVDFWNSQHSELHSGTSRDASLCVSKHKQII